MFVCISLNSFKLNILKCQMNDLEGHSESADLRKGQISQFSQKWNFAAPKNGVGFSLAHATMDKVSWKSGR